MKIIRFILAAMLLLSFAYSQIVRPRNQDFDPKPQANPKNPFDFFGEMHNDGVKEIGDLLGWRRSPKDTIYAKTVWYMTKEGSKDFAGMYAARKASFQAKDMPSMDSMLVKQGASKMDILYIRKLMALLDNTSLTSRQAYITEVKKLEDQVMAEPGITTDMGNLILASASVARYSVEFWDGMAQSNPEVVGISAGSTSGESFVKVKDVVKGDVKGAIKGAIVTGITGFLGGGPAGGLAGAGAGALGGAIGGSIAAALFD
ncbi:MAG: hypothetical protein R3D00_24740 [Bacteroidia bacterium]